ncbi:MAG: efflux RND transporter periplasmic adaptor subunit [Acidobacteriaceae bacterium]
MKMFNRGHRPAPLVMLGLAALLAVCGCERTNSKGGEVKSEADSGSAQFFTVPEDQRSHLQIVTVQPTTLTRTLRLTGAVAYNSFRTTPVISQVSGPVSRVLVVPGQKVSHGQAMLYVASPDYSQLRANFLKAKDANSLAQKSYTRAQDLYQHHAISEQNLEQAQSASVQAGSDLISAEAALKVMGVSDPESLIKAPPSFEVPVKAPIAGEVVEQLVSAGQLLQPGNTQCFTISDTSTVWVLVNVYQKDLPYVRVGDQVTITTDAYPDVFKGKISYVAASVDASTRTLQARIETANPAKKLKKDMFVVASVSTGKIENAVAVPDSAVLRDSENQPFVYAEVSTNQYGRRGITAGESINGQTQITSGLKSGDRVVGNGSLFLQFANSLQK